MSFTIVTDSCANLTPAQIKDYEIKIVPLTYTVGDTEYLGYIEGEEPDYKGFYDMLRGKEHVKTSLVSYDRVEKALRSVLETGEDVLYLVFSSALSGSCQIVRNCAADIAEEYPNRKITVVDTLCASMGQGLLVKYAVDKKNSGASLEETAAWVEKNKGNLVHLFTVDDLFFLKRGGRLSGGAAVVGTILGIKPLLHVNDEGKLVSYGKVRGRKTSLDSLIQKMEELAIDIAEQEVFVAHGDCPEDAEYVAEEIKARFGVKKVAMNYIDAVIGAHSGPGTLAIFFIGKSRI